MGAAEPPPPGSPKKSPWLWKGHGFASPFCCQFGLMFKQGVLPCIFPISKLCLCNAGPGEKSKHFLVCLVLCSSVFLFLRGYRVALGARSLSKSKAYPQRFNTNKPQTIPTEVYPAISSPSNQLRSNCFCPTVGFGGSPTPVYPQPAVSVGSRSRVRRPLLRDFECREAMPVDMAEQDFAY